MRGQGALEYLIITAAVLAISAVVVLFLTGALGGGATGAQVSACKQAASQCGVQQATTTGAACTQCEKACVDTAGKDIMSGASGCGVACGFCKQGKAMRISGPLPAGVVGFWSFEENSGTSTADVSGNANTGTINNGAAWANGKLGYALSFDGTDDYVRVTHNAILTPTSISVEMWLYLASNPNCNADNNWRSILYKGPNACCVASGYDVLLEDGGGITWDVGDGTMSQRYYSDIAGGLQVGSWTHLVVTYDASAGESKIYKNGQQMTGTYWARFAGPRPIASSTNDLLITKPSNPCPAEAGNFPGILDEIRIYNRALTETEIRNLFSSA